MDIQESSRVNRWDLKEIISPLTVADFVGRYYRREYVHITNGYSKFADLMPWPVLNDILKYHRIDPPQLSLIKDGIPVPVDSYVRTIPERNSTMPRLMIPELTAHLREGATLIIDKVQYMYAPIGSLAEQLERALGNEIGVNLYAGWRSSRGFNLHYDDHDVFILQVAGKKHWTVFRPTIQYPLAHSPQMDAFKPSGEPAWDGLLSPGDMLYIPRGWWHVAVPCDEPTLHLTVGMVTLTGIDLFRWLIAKIANEERMRMDIPHITDTSQQDTFLTMFRETISAAIMDKGLLKEFYQHINTMADPSPTVGLPWSATPQVLPPSGSYIMSLASTHPLEVRHQPEAGVVEVGVRGKVLTFNDAILPLLRFIENRRRVRASTFYEAFDESCGHEALVVFVTDLVKNGILSLIEMDDESIDEHLAALA